MMEAIIALLIAIAFIVGMFLDVALFSAPGALFRRVFLGHKKPFKELYKERVFLNFILGLVAVLVLYVAVVLIVKQP